MTDLFIGLVLGAMVGIVTVSAIAIPEIDRLRGRWRLTVPTETALLTAI